MTFLNTFFYFLCVVTIGQGEELFFANFVREAKSGNQYYCEVVTAWNEETFVIANQKQNGQKTVKNEVRFTGIIKFSRVDGEKVTELLLCPQKLIFNDDTECKTMLTPLEIVVNEENGDTIFRDSATGERLGTEVASVLKMIFKLNVGLEHQVIYGQPKSGKIKIGDNWLPNMNVLSAELVKVALAPDKITGNVRLMSICNISNIKCMQIHLDFNASNNTKSFTINLDAVFPVNVQQYGPLNMEINTILDQFVNTGSVPFAAGVRIKSSKTFTQKISLQPISIAK